VNWQQKIAFFRIDEVLLVAQDVLVDQPLQQILLFLGKRGLVINDSCLLNDLLILRPDVIERPQNLQVFNLSDSLI
jgi:hypothetical protein